MADDIALPDTPAPASTGWSILPSIMRMLASVHTPGEAFGLPANAVRATITFALVLTYLYLQWQSPKPQEYIVPPTLMAAVGLVVGFYLTGEASPTMKALLSLLFVTSMSAFMLRYGWVPESVATQTTTCLGIYFGKRMADGVKQGTS